MIHLKFHGDFKSHINFRRIKRWVIALLYNVTLQGMRLYSASRPLESNEAKTSVSCFFKSSMGRDRDINFFEAGQWHVISFFFFFFF
jgi:hypothetical protein